MSTGLSKGVKIPETGSTNWDVDVNNNFALLNTAIEDIENKADKSEIPDVSNLQEKLTAGDNITIENNVISATGGDLSEYAKKSELANVATSGSYDDLSDKPTIPDVSNYYTKSETDEKLEDMTVSIESISDYEIEEICV